MSRADLVVATGGDVFSSDYGALEHHLAPLRAAREFGKPYVFLAHSIGPFKTDVEAASFSEVARDAAGISLRESLSYEYVRETLGLDGRQVSKVADPAFLLEPPPADAVDALLEMHGIDPEVPFVVLCPSRGIARYAATPPEHHLATWRQTVAFVHDRLTPQVVLLPHVQEVNPSNDDRAYATTILRGMGWSDGARVVGGDLTAAEFKGIISRSVLTVSERMHAAIAGLSSGVPVTAIAYSVKARGIVRDFCGEDAAALSLLDLDAFLERGTRESHLLRGWEMRGSLAEGYRSGRAVSVREAESAFGELDGVLRSRVT